MAGTRKDIYFAQHAPYGMVNARYKICRTEGCGKQPSLEEEGTTAEYCKQHASDGMANVKSGKCTTEGCRNQPSFGVEGTKTAE